MLTLTLDVDLVDEFTDQEARSLFYVFVDVRHLTICLVGIGLCVVWPTANRGHREYSANAENID